MRDVVFFQWPKSESTVKAIKTQLAAAYDRIASSEVNDIQSVLFVHVKENMFQLIFEDHNN